MAATFDTEQFLKTLSHRPGVYRMLDGRESVIYVGKARDLKKRVSSYFGSKAFQPKTQALMNKTARVEVTVTGTEQEALLLEYNLIKEHQPRFNVLLRDGKSYPYIRVTLEQDFPRFEFHRGARNSRSRYFGPFPSAGAVRQTLGQLQKLFQVRQCGDSFFSNRSRPCLQYQIKRCSAPCVSFIDADSYRRDVDNTLLFLAGKNDAVLSDLMARMDHAAGDLNYEQAAQYRDQITAIKSIQAGQVVSGSRMKDADVLSVQLEHGVCCVTVVMIRGGRMLGSRNFFPRTAAHTEAGEVLSAFIVQHYFNQAAPPEILVNAVVEEQALLEEVLGKRVGYRIAIRRNVRGHRRRWLEIAASNAEQGLASHRAEKTSLQAQLELLSDLLNLDDVPDRIECFDISHTSGEETVASCVVFGRNGAVKSEYRRFNIKGIPAGDDYSAIAQAMERRYLRVKRGEAPIPDLIMVDGGRGQLARASETMEELQLGDIQLISIAKGQGRKAGREKIYVPGNDQPVPMAADSAAMHLLQQIRDEAHRFAITGHRQRRSKVKQTSVLESIPGLGPARRKALLRQFGGLQGVRRSGVDDLAKVRGISRALAERIYGCFHGG
jgi:excinuclease ABC subunit C